MQKKIIFIVILISFIRTDTYSHDLCRLFWSNFYLQHNYAKNQHNSLGLEYNRSFTILNYGFLYKDYYQTNKNEFNGYIGIGLVNFFQIQYSYSSNKESKLRLKASIMLKDLMKNSYNDSYENWKEQISMCIFYERGFSENTINEFGIGIGYSFNICWGPPDGDHAFMRGIL
jgi:hypothetical protein